jgi:hypothetical protein
LIRRPTVFLACYRTITTVKGRGRGEEVEESQGRRGHRGHRGHRGRKGRRGHRVEGITEVTERTGCRVGAEAARYISERDAEREMGPGARSEAAGNVEAHPDDRRLHEHAGTDAGIPPGRIERRR